MARRGTLSTETVVEAALKRLAEHGLDALSMRTLAGDLDVSPMALYRHVHSKDELLDLMADRVISRFVPAPADVPWAEQAARICRQIRTELLAHSGVANRVTQRPIPSSGTSMQVNGAIVSMLVESGLPRDKVPSTYWVLSTYTIGSVLLEIEHRRLKRERATQDSAARRQNLTTLLNALQAEVADTDALAAVLSAPYDDRQFEFGLAAVISGLEAIVDAGSGGGSSS